MTRLIVAAFVALLAPDGDYVVTRQLNIASDGTITGALSTKWLVEDRCNSTLTRVARGRVSVRDFAKKKTVIVKAGKKYVARRRP
jgi:ferric-dicitrate binding protein FerR (iron transport regulator)